MITQFRKPLAVLMLAGLVMTGCGSDKPSDNNMEESSEIGWTNALGKIENMAKEMEKATDQNSDANKKRIARGDTVAIFYEELAKFLPASVSGFEAGELQGSTSNSMGVSVSNAKRRFENDEKYVEVELYDYNSPGGLTSAMLFPFTMAAEISMEDTNVKQTGFKQGSQIKGSHMYRKGDKVAELSAVVAGRFVIMVKANEQPDMEFVKSVFNNFNLDKLSDM